MSRRETVSSRQMTALRWTRLSPPGEKCGAKWKHESGWRLEHCGHPTANHPWQLFAPDGRPICTGVLYNDPPRPDFGTCWDTLSLAVRYVAEVQAGVRTLPAPASEARS